MEGGHLDNIDEGKSEKLESHLRSELQVIALLNFFYSKATHNKNTLPHNSQHPDSGTWDL